MATPFPSLTNTWHSNSYPAISPSRAELSTKGKVIAITGGGTGIGASITRAFATAGSTKLAILGRRDKVLKETAHAIQTEFPGTKVLPIVADVTDAAAVQAAFDAIVKEFGKIDVCISNAGYLSAVESIVASEADDWWKSFETNVKGAFNIARAFLSHAKPGATLLGLTTCVAHMPSVPGHSAYAASKIAGAKMHEYLADEHPDIHFVSMHPGVIVTDMSMKSGFPGLDHGKIVSWRPYVEED
jgi:NAD(P)-dependent dehydrogenase (short-subunit alcohol dehydrogenase family)